MFNTATSFLGPADSSVPLKGAAHFRSAPHLNDAGKNAGVCPTTYLLYKGDMDTPIEGGVIEESMVCISVNGRELATFMCSPIQLADLALGFLRSEGFIRCCADVEVLHLADSGTCVDIWLRNGDFTPPTRKIITSGCGGGVTFDDLSARHPPLLDGVTVTPQQIIQQIQQLHLAAELYNEVRGVHTSALSDGLELLLVAQDVGRHNTIDRLWGQALQRGIDPAGCMLLASGRISSEMLNKAAKMGIPVVASRTSPTSLSVELARAWNITVIGYARGNQFRVYTAPQRVVSCPSL
ncbi:MAG: formate dehydrogenase accessory sulfurtransferase FdhD [Pleurocapsa sp. SU_196_0]|nr:formate dehydrogenase accessory sulfurtransferase FdhD [Pleurocapsa sp. SU_196_0]